MTKSKKTMLISGGNSGLGFECAKNIARDPDWHIVIASRNQEKSAQAVQKLIAYSGNTHIQALTLDLASLTAVRSFVQEFTSLELPPLHAVACNAGIQNISGTYHTKDGYEMTFGVNHLGHFLLTLLLLPHLAHPARIVFVSSGTHDPERKTMMPPPVYTTARELAFPSKDSGMTPQELERLGMQRYSTSKLCNVLCVYELARRLKASAQAAACDLITVNALDPGLMLGTGLARDYTPLRKLMWSMLGPLVTPFIANANSVAKSGKVLAQLLCDPHLESVTGKYFIGLKESGSSKTSYDVSLATDLWDTSIELAAVTSDEIRRANVA